jgi:predicted DCC family thiol-disulfide oxidoreductase YuxK
MCDRSVQFVLKRDRHKKFRFASLQGEKGQKILKQFSLPANDFYSFVLVEDDKVYTRSTGALRVLKLLGGVWKLVYGLVIIPEFIRDGVYNWIARNRYKWFGKKQECRIPTPEERERFLD